MRRNLVIAAALLFSLSPAFAQQQAPAPQAPAQSSQGRPTPELKAARQAVRQACTEDARNLCAGSEAGGGKIMMCLRSHKDQVSDGCKAAFQHLREVRKGA